jgi:hypothetical protein
LRLVWLNRVDAAPHDDCCNEAERSDYDQGYETCTDSNTQKQTKGTEKSESSKAAAHS